MGMVCLSASCDYLVSFLNHAATLPVIPLEFIRPWFLLFALPLAAVVIYYYLHSLSDFPRRQRMVSLGTRLVVIVLLVLALSGLTLLRSTDELFVVFVTDQSLSVGEEAQAATQKFLHEAWDQKGHHRAAWLPFSKTIGRLQEDLPEEKQANDEEEKTTAEPSAEEKAAQEGTNLAAAIEAAAGHVPPGYVPRIVVLSDGNETGGDALAAAAQSDIAIDTIALPGRSDPEVQVSAVNVPAEIQEGAPFYVETVIHSNHEDEALIEIFRGDHKVVSEKKKLTAGENRLQFQQSIERDKLAVYTARISGLKEDTLLDNNSDSGLVYSSGKPRVLIIESDPSLIRDLVYALEDEGIQADTRPPQGMPDTLADLQNYECMIVSNVPATDLTGQQMRIARTYVQDLGGGFIMLGGEQSFGLGGYYKTVLEEILPVRSDFEKEKEKPSLGMVLVIDKSGSMNGDKIEMAKSAARAAAEILGRRDQVAVLAFDGSTFVISEMQTADNKARISSDIGRLDAGGGTNMYPAMEMAYQMLNTTPAKLKHVILLTDGVSQAGDFVGLAQTMASAKMTVSTVAIGDGSDTELLDSIARTGRGRHYVTNDPTQIPQIFAKETVTASKSAIDEQPFIPQVIRATHALADIDMDNAPFLLGYVMTRPKPTSEVILATEKGDPLLAWWRYGLGMTAAFTSDAKTRWAAEWMTWPGYGKFWTQVIRQTMRKGDARGIQVAVDRQGDIAHVAVDAVNEAGQFLNDATVEATIIQPGLKQEKQTLVQTAPGRYAMQFPTPRQGAYHLEISVKQGDNVVYRQSRGLMIGYSDELRIRPPNEELLQAVASTSGGKFAPSVEEVFRTTGQVTTRPTPLWPWLLGAAAFLLILDVALRRIDFSLFYPFNQVKAPANAA